MEIGKGLGGRTRNGREAEEILVERGRKMRGEHASFGEVEILAKQCTMVVWCGVVWCGADE